MPRKRKTSQQVSPKISLLRQLDRQFKKAIDAQEIVIDYLKASRATVAQLAMEIQQEQEQLQKLAGKIEKKT